MLQEHLAGKWKINMSFNMSAFLTGCQEKVTVYPSIEYDTVKCMRTATLPYLSPYF